MNQATNNEEYNDSFDSILYKNIHSSWIVDLPHGQLLNKLRDSSAAEKLANMAIKKHLKIHNETSLQRTGTLGKIHSFDSDEMTQLVFRIGAIQISGVIKQAIKAEEIISIKESLGNELYSFVISHSSTLLPIEQKYNEITPSHKSLMINVINAGFAALCTALNDVPHNFILKLPKSWNDVFVLSQTRTLQPDFKGKRPYKELVSYIIDTIISGEKSSKTTPN